MINNNAKRRRHSNIRAKAAKLDEELQHQIAKVEQAIESSRGDEREQYRALLRRLQQVLAMQPEV